MRREDTDYSPAVSQYGDCPAWVAPSPDGSRIHVEVGGSRHQTLTITPDCFPLVLQIDTPDNSITIRIERG